MRLGDLRVRHRIGVLAAVPLTVSLLLTAPLVIERMQSASESARSASKLELARQVGGVIADLQRERLLCGAYLAIPGSAGNPVVQQAARTDAHVSDLRERLESGESPALTAALSDVSDLDRARRLVLERGLTSTDANTQYSALISALINALRLNTTDAGASEGTLRNEQAAMEALLRVQEDSSSLGASLLAVVSNPDQTRQLMGEVEGRTAEEAAERSRFFRVASPSEAELFQAVESGSAAAKIKSYADALALWAYADQDGGLQHSERPDGVTVPRILAAADSQDQLRLLVQNKTSRDASALASHRAAQANSLAVLFLLAALALSIGMVWLTARIARSIAKPLGLLHGAAEQVAQAADAELTRVADETVAGSSPAETAAHLMRVPELGKDELGELAVAFNRVQEAAVTLIERQVRSSTNTTAMLGNVGRRTQNLAALQLTMIDAMERGETDPALLERLYRLDHVSSRLRRYANCLIVLSGWAEPGLQGSTVALSELTRSSLSTIEGFQRVQVGHMPAVQVAPHAASDLALLLAELLDNATSFSPPATSVECFADQLPGGHVEIRIIDHGIGISADRLAEENARLVRQERLDLVPTEVLGLFVIGRLSRRHRLQVRLDHTPGGGVTAHIMLPPEVFRMTEPAEWEAAPRELESAFVAPEADAVAELPREAGALEELNLPTGTPALTLVASGGQASVSEEQVTADTSSNMGRILSVSPSSAGAFDWFNRQLEDEIKRVLDHRPVLPGPDPESFQPPTPWPALVAVPTPSDDQDWSRSSADVAAPAPAPTDFGASAEGIQAQGRLVRRVPGAQMPTGSVAPENGFLGAGPMDPEAVRTMIKDFEAGVALAAEAGTSPERD
ncbi:nitrate- and nitrite sensing domain-containing protein [Streptomyces sp. NPDC016566]|uniref:sensor histidine kinase n=1 Tax=Streptomyces sp. NPDC016566 TaxID=3364967 RepID=UPI003702D57F